MARKLVVEVVGDTSSLERSLKSAGERTAKFDRATEKLQHRMKEAGEHTKHFGGGLGALGSTAELVAGGAGLGALAIGLHKATEAAEADQVANARLEQSFKNAHVAIGPFKDKIEEAENAGAKLGFTGESVVDSLGKLVTATGSGKKSLEELTTVEDLARFKHIDLASAADMVTKAQTGSQRALKALGLEVATVTDEQDKAKIAFRNAKDAINEQFGSTSKLTDAQKAHRQALIDAAEATEKASLTTAVLKDHESTATNIVKELNTHLHGQAQAYSETAAGAKEKLGAELERLEVIIGSKVLPVLAGLTAKLADVLDWMITNWPKFSAEFNKVADRIQDIWDTKGRPVFEAVRTVVGAVAEDARALWNTFGGSIERITQNTADAVEGILRGLVKTIGGIFNLVGDLIHGRWGDIWGDLKQIVSGVIDAATSALEGMVKNLAVVGAKIGGALKEGIVGAMQGIGSAMESLVKHAINGVIDIVNDAIDHMNDVLNIDVGPIHIHAGKIPTLPHVQLAQGGIVTGPTLALIGEAGPEAVVPLGRGGGMGTTVHVTVNGWVGSDQDLANRIVKAVTAANRGGRLLVSDLR